MTETPKDINPENPATIDTEADDTTPEAHRGLLRRTFVLRPGRRKTLATRAGRRKSLLIKTGRRKSLVARLKGRKAFAVRGK